MLPSLPVIVLVVATPPARLELREAFEGQRDDDDRISRGGQRRAGSGGAERRRGGRSQRKRGVAAEQRGLFLAHRLLQQAKRRGRVDVLEALRGGFGFEGHRVFFAERQIGRDLQRRDIRHARGALAFGHPAHRVVAGAGDRSDSAPARGVAGIGPRDARQRVPQRRDDRIKVLGRRLKIVGGEAGGDGDALGQRFLHQAESFLRGLGDVHGGFLVGLEGAAKGRAPTAAAPSGVAGGWRVEVAKEDEPRGRGVGWR